MQPMGKNNILLEVNNVKKYFPVKKGLFTHAKKYVRAVDDISLYIEEGETLGLVGESGSGKSTLGKCIIRAHEVTEGEIKLKIDKDQVVDLAGLSSRELQPIRKYMHMIFQDPYASLNARMTVLDIIGEPLECNNLAKGQERVDRIKELAKDVGLEVEHLVRYPHAFSGGQRQRIGIARSLAPNPKLIICDEAVSALDVSIQAQILNLLKDLQEKYQPAYLFIAHDLAVVEYIADRVAVMYTGQIVELAATGKLFQTPRHPYTEALMSAIPRTNPNMKMKRIVLPGDVADPSDPPTGCYFHPRCQYAQNICSREKPVWEEVNKGHYVLCHRAKKLKLKGVAQ
jgi:peptide/nickel transport system ATP-binding protein